MGLIDFIKGARDEVKEVTSDVVDTIMGNDTVEQTTKDISGAVGTVTNIIKGIQNTGLPMPFSDDKYIVEGNVNKLGKIINTQNIPAGEINTNYIGQLENIFSDGKVTDTERQSVASLPKIYQRLFSDSKSLDELKSYVYTDEFLKADPVKTQEMKDLYKTTLENFNKNIKDIERIKPGTAKNDEMDKKYMETQYTKFGEKMTDVETTFGKNSDVGNAYAQTVLDAANDVSDVISQAREGGLQDDPTFLAMVADLQKKKDQRQEAIYLALKNNSKNINDWNDAFSFIENNDTIKTLAKNTIDVREDIGQYLMKKSTEKSIKEGRQIYSAIKGAELGFSYLERGVNELAQQAFTTKATDLSDLEYLSTVNSKTKNAAGKMMNWAIRNAGELSAIFVPVGGLLKAGGLAVKGIANVGKIAKIVDASYDASKILTTLSKLDKPFNLVKGTVGIDSAFDYNLSAGMSDENTATNLLFNVVGEGYSAIRAGLKDYKQLQKTKLMSADIEGMYENSWRDINIDPEDPSKTVKVNMVDVLGGAGAKNNTAATVLQTIGDAAIIDVATFKQSLDNALDGFKAGIETGTKQADSEAKGFVRSMLWRATEENPKLDPYQKKKVMDNLELKMSNKDGLLESIDAAKSFANDFAKVAVHNITTQTRLNQTALNSMGYVPIENIEKIISQKTDFLKGLSETFSGADILPGTKKAVDKIAKKVSETGKVSDSDVMSLVRSFNESRKGTDAVKYIGDMQKFMQNSLGYLPEGLKSVENIKSLIDLSNSSFIKNLKGAKIGLKFKNLGTGIGGTFKDSGAIISLYKDFYKTPDDFVIGFIHELTHGLINKNSKLHSSLSVGYASDVSKINQKFSSIYDGFDVRNIDEKKLTDTGFDAEEIEYLKTFGYRYKNIDEYIAYGLSEALLGKKVGESFDILKQKVKSVANTAFDVEISDDVFRAGADRLLNERFKFSNSKKTVAKDIENYSYSSIARKQYANTLNRLAKSTMEVGSLSRFQEIIEGASLDELANIMKDDKEILNIIETVRGSDDEITEEFLKQSLANGIFTGATGYDTIVAGGLFEVFGDFQTYVKNAERINDAVDIEKYFNQGQGQIFSIMQKLDFLMNNLITKGDKSTRILKTLTDLKAMAQYYSYIDVLGKIGNRPEHLGLKNFIISKMDKLESFGGQKMKELYGMKKGGKSSEILARGISDVVKDLQSEVGTKGVELYDYLLRSMKKSELINEKISTIGFGAWKEIVDNLGLKVSKKVSSIQDIGNQLAKVHYMKADSATGSLYGLGRVFGYDDKILKGNFATRMLSLEKISNGSEVVEIISKNANGIETTTKDILNFVGLPDFDLNSNNLKTVFDIIYDKYDFAVADKIASRIADVFRKEFGEDVVAQSLENARQIGITMRDGLENNRGLLESTGIYPQKKDIGELIDIARPDISINANGTIGSIVADDGLTYKFLPEENKFVANVNQSQALIGNDLTKGTVSASLVFENETKNIYGLAGTTKTPAGAKKVVEFLNGVIWSNKLKTSGVKSFGMSVDELSRLDDVPTDLKQLNAYIKKYEKLYQDCIDNFGIDDDVTKFVGIKKGIANQYSAYKKVTDDVQYFGALADVGTKTYNELDGMVSELKLLLSNKNYDDAAKLEQASNKVGTVWNNFTKEVLDKSDKSGSVNKVIKGKKILQMPGSKQSWGFTPETFTSVEGIRSFIRRLEVSMKDMSMSTLQDSGRYTSRLSEGKIMLDEIKKLAINGLNQKSFAIESVENLSKYGDEDFSPSTVEKLFNNFERARNNFNKTLGENSVKGHLPFLEKGASDTIKDAISTNIAGRYGLDKEAVRAGITFDYVKPEVAKITYTDGEGILRSYYINTSTMSDAEMFYQYALTRDEIIDGAEVSFKIGGAGDDIATHTVTVDGSKYNGLLETQMDDGIYYQDGELMMSIRQEASKKAFGTEFMNDLVKDNSMGIVKNMFGFLMENKAILKESSYETYKIVSEYDAAITNNTSDMARIMRQVAGEKKELLRFGEVYKANKEYVKALLLSKGKILKKGLIIEKVLTHDLVDVKKAFDSGGYTLEKFMMENGFEIKEMDLLNDSIKFNEKNMADYGQYAGIKYYLDKIYGPNVLMEYRGKSTDYIDYLMNFYAGMFQSIYKNMGHNIDKDVILDRIMKYMLNKKSQNIVGFNNDIRGSFNVFEEVTGSLVKDGVYDGLTTIYDSMAKGTLSEEMRKRIFGDLTGESLRGKSSLMKLISRIRTEAYSLQLGWWSPKAWVIASQNIVSNAVEVFSKRSSLSGTSDEVLKINQRMLDSKYLSELVKQTNGKDGKLIIGLNLATASKGKNLEIGGTSTTEKILNWFVDMMADLKDNAKNKLGIDKSATDWINDVASKELDRESVKAFINNPVGVADMVMQGNITNSFVYDKIFGDLNISPTTINAMLDRIDELDEILLSTKGLDRDFLQAEKSSILKDIKSIWHYASREALFEYQQIYKAGQMAGLMRNGFSRRTALTFFSSWGAKKSGEYLYNAFYKPMVSAYTAYKLGGMGAVGKVLANELLTNVHWNALVKQSLYSARSMYQLNKDSNLDTVGEENFGKWFMTVSPLGQALKSFFITRAGIEGYDQTKLAIAEGASMSSALQYGLSNALYSATSQLFKDLKFFAVPIAQALNETGTKGGDEKWLEATVDKIANSFTSSLYYSLYDMYAGLPSERLDSDTMYPFLDAVMGDTVTKYRYDMDKMMDAVFIDDAIENGEIEIKWVEQIKNGMFGMPKSYNKRFALDQLNAVKDNDEVFKRIVAGDLKGIISDKKFPDQMKSRLMKDFMRNNMIGEFDSSSDKGDINGKVALILNDLKSQGVDTDTLTIIMNSGNLKSAQKELAVLAASGMTKAESMVVLSFMVNKAYSEISKQYTKAKLSLSKNPEIKEQVYKQLFDIVMPVAAEVDKTVASDVLFGYIQNTYGGKVPGLNAIEFNKDGTAKGSSGTDSNIIKMFKLGLLADVADGEDVGFNRKLLTSAGQRILQDTPDELVAKKTAEMFQFVDELKTVRDSGKMVAKAAMLYGNLDRMKILLNSKYAPGMQDEMNKLADIIWETNDQLQCTPELLNALTYGGGSGTGKKKIKAPKSYELQKDVVKKVDELTKSMPKELKTFALSLKSQRIKAKLQALSLPTLKQEKYDTYTDSKLTPIGGGTDLKTGSLKVGEGKSKKTSPKIKSPKPAKSGSVSNSGIKRSTPIKIQRVKEAE